MLDRDDRLGARASRRLARAALSLGLGGRQAEIDGVLRALAASWYDRPASERVNSIHVVDGSPLELSAPVGAAEPELRFTVEPQAPPFDLDASFRAGRAALEAAAAFGAATAPLDGLLSAFEPVAVEAPGFALWLGAVFRGARPPAFKIYLNASFAEARGTPWHTLLAPRLGEARVAALRAALGPHLDAGIVSFDLDAASTARTKLYVAHAHPGPRDGALDLDAVVRLARLGADDGTDARALVEHLAPEALDPSSEVAFFVGTTLHLVGGEVERVTTNLQLLPFGAPPPDQTACRERLRSLAASLGCDAAASGTLLEALAPELPADTRTLTYVSVQRERARPRITVYASPVLRAG